jgi:hypothetical protein
VVIKDVSGLIPGERALDVEQLRWRVARAILWLTDFAFERMKEVAGSA